MKIFFLTVVSRLYVIWGRVYRFFKGYPKAMVVPDYTHFKSFEDFFNNMKETWLKQYKKDGVWQLGDVIAHPFDTMKKGFGDCDDYAATMSYLLPESFNLSSIEYSFVGMFGLIFHTKPHHMIAVWKSDFGYTVVSARNLYTFVSWNDMLQAFSYKDRPLEYIAHFDVTHYRDKFDVKFKKVEKA